MAAGGGREEKLFDGFFRGDWAIQPAQAGTWLVSSIGGAVRLIDVEQRKPVWEYRHADPFSAPTFSPDGRRVAVAFPESRDRDAIWLIDSATGLARIAVRFPTPFRSFFRMGWLDEGHALVVNRFETRSHIVLFDRFWVRGPAIGAAQSGNGQ